MFQAVRWSFLHRALHLAGGAWFRLKGRVDNNARIELANIRRVLVVRLDGIGDVVLTTPFLRALRDNLPGAWITLLVRPAIRNLVELCPHVNEVLTYEPAGSPYWRSFQATSGALNLARTHLWQHDYDLAIAPRWDTDSHYGSLVVFLSGARQRLGYSEKVTEEKSRLNAGLDRLLTHAIGGGELKHEVERNLQLIAFMRGTIQEDRLELWCGEADELFADRILATHGANDGGPLIAIAPGAGHPKRIWPLARYAEFCAWVAKHCGGTVLVVGNQEEERLGKELASRLAGNVINAAGRTSLRETAALLKRCQLFVGNDSGPMHLAAAAGLPVIEISCHPLGGSPGHVNSPARFGPWHVPQILLRPAEALGPCSDACVSDEAHCIRGVPVGQVEEAAVSLLLQWERTPH